MNWPRGFETKTGRASLRFGRCPTFTKRGISVIDQFGDLPMVKARAHEHMDITPATGHLVVPAVSRLAIRMPTVVVALATPPRRWGEGHPPTRTRSRRGLETSS